MTAREPTETSEITQWLVLQVATLLGVSPEEVNIHAEFPELGLDSAAGVELVGHIENRFGGQLSPTVVWDYPTIEKLAAHLAKRPPKKR